MPTQTESSGLDISFDLDAVTLQLTKAIDAKKVETADLNAQFEAVNQSNIQAEAEGQAAAAKRLKGEKEAASLALAARKSPGSIGMTFAGPDASGVNKLESLIPSRITSRGKGRSI